MIQQYLGISPDKLIKAGWETLYMVGFSLIIGSIVGFFIAIVLWLTRKGGLKENPLLYTVYHPSGMCNALYENHRRHPDRYQGGYRAISYLYRPIFSKTS